MSKKSEDKAIRIVFDRFDTNHDGKINSAELKEGLKSLKLPTKGEDVAILMKKMDKNRDGEISYEVVLSREFCRLFDWKIIYFGVLRRCDPHCLVEDRMIVSD
jgi:Ca2+-binding EF-hand superfamily protein